MNNITASAKIKFFNWHLAGGPELRPASWTIALHFDDPGIYGDQNEIDTGYDPNYVRKDVTWSAPVSFDNGTSICINNEDLTWTAGVGASFDVVGLSIKDENGEAIAWGLFSEKTTVVEGEIFRIYADSILVVIDEKCRILRERLLLYLFTNATMVQALSVVAALHTGDPGSDGADNEVQTSQDSSYVHKQVIFSVASEFAGTGKVKLSSDWASWTPAANSPGYTVTWTSYKDGANGDCLAIAPRLKEMVMAAGVPSPGTTGEILAY
jgi:hypothetical protein